MTTTYGYVQKLQNRLEWAYHKTQESNEKEHHCYKRNCDRNIHCTKLCLGDLVLVWKKPSEINVKYRIIGKTFRIKKLEKINLILPIYCVQCEEDTKSKVLYHNL